MIAGISAWAASIYHWLSRYQILQEELLPSKPGEKAYIFEHPLLRKVGIDLQETDSRRILKRLHGVGIDIQSKRIIDFGGIFDPLAGFVVGDHYASSHFAWLASMLDEGSPAYERISAALSFHEHHSRRYPFAADEPHWEFNNYAWMETWLFLHRRMPTLAKRLKLSLLHAPWHPRPYGTNWKLMLASFLLLRGKTFHRPLDLLLGQGYLAWSLKMQDHDGCILDVPRNGSRSLQYHAYSTALLFRMWEHGLFWHPSLKRRTLKAAKWLAIHTAPDGNCNWRGRGQFQLFGYAAALYVFAIAARFNPDKADRYLSRFQRLSKFLEGYQQPEGSWPLVLNGFPDEEHIGWYDYNYKTVYNAFAGVWFQLAYQAIEALSSNSHSWHFNKSSVYLQNSGVFICNNDKLFFSVSSGERNYKSESGFAPQVLWIDDFGMIIGGVGGVGREPYGSLWHLLQADLNYYAPLVIKGDHIIGPAHERHKLEYRDGVVYITARYGGISVVRTIHCNPEQAAFLSIVDIIQVNSGDALTIIPFNLPILAGSREIRVEEHLLYLSDAKHVICIDVRIENDFAELALENPEPQVGGLSVRAYIPARDIQNSQTIRVEQIWTQLH